MRTSLGLSTGAKKLARMAWDDGVRRIGAIHGHDDLGHEFDEAFTAAFRAAGGDLTGDPPASQHVDPGPVLATYRKEILDAMEGATLVDGKAAVAVQTSPEAFQVILRDIAGSKIPVRLYAAHTVRAQGVLAENAAAAEGMRGVFPARGKEANYRAYEASFKKTYPEADPNSAWFPHAYDALVVYALAVARSPDDPTGDQIKASLRRVANAGLGKQVVGPDNLLQALQAVQGGADVDYQGASGAVDFGSTGGVLGGWVEYQVQGGQFVDLAR